MAVGYQICLYLSFLVWVLLLVLGFLILISYHKKKKEVNKATSSSDFSSSSCSSEVSSCSSSSCEEGKYDVFLSFRGEDTGGGFVGYLYDALCKKGIHTYMDEQSLESGHGISMTLMKAIEESKICIIVLSQNFASSTWCLDELGRILRYKRNENVIPIFYGIDPSIVRKQKDNYVKAFANHERHFRDNKMEKVKQWRVALEEVADLSGYDSKNFSHEFKLVQKVVEDILLKLHKYQLTNCGHIFGFEEPIKTIESLLSIGSMDVRIIGIWGMGGIGKTTISNFVFLKFAYQYFDGYCFLKDISEEGDGTDHLRYKVFCEILKDKNLLWTDTVVVGSRFIQDRLRCKKVFIVIDELKGRRSKLHDLFGGYQFANGSGIIVTSRDKQLLSTMANSIYELKGLCHCDALKLFCFHAFGPNSLAVGYEAFLEYVASYAKGNPLALKVLGSSLKSKSIREWESALDKLKTHPNADIQKVLRISFDGLGDKGIQDILLDMACFFTDEVLREDVESKLNGTEHSNASIGISVLIDKSLLIHKEKKSMWVENKDPVKIYVKMHDLLRQMGRGIVLDENNYSGNRSRVWNVKDVCHVLERNTGTSTIEGILLNLEDLKKDVKVSRTAFSNMYNLRILKITHSNDKYLNKLVYSWEMIEGREHIYLPDGLMAFVSDDIRYFHWDSYPLKHLPDLSTENLVELIMRESQLELLWNEDQPLELVKLKKINLSFSKHLIQIPNLSWAINLQDIHLQHCTSLVHIPPFFQNLNELQFLDMTNCKNVEDGIENLPNNLRYLRMGGTTIKSLPESIWNLKCLEKLDLSDCRNLRNIPEISNHKEESPKSIENLTVLRFLCLSGCDAIKFLPNSLCKLLHLERLTLARCSSLEELPPLPHGLKELDISKCERLKLIAELPSSLRGLDANDCTLLETISRWEFPSKLPFWSYWFKNCLKLDYYTRNNLIAGLAHLLSLSGQDDVRYFHYIMYPGDEIPEWFSYQADGGNSINIHLPPNWFKLPLRSVFCIVFYDRDESNIRYEFNLKTNTSNSDYRLFHYHDHIDCSFPGTTYSHHVYIVSTPFCISKLSKVFGPNWYSICSNSTEASFRVSFNDRKDDSTRMIKKFGFRFYNADCGFEKELNVDRASSNQPKGHQHNGYSLPHNNSKGIKHMG